MRLIDVDELWKDITSEIDDCSDVLDIIKRQTLIDTSKELVICPVKVNMDIDEIMEFIKERGWEPVEHGHWIKISEGEWKCSNCGNWWSFDDSSHIDGCYKHCPDCGAKMDEVIK